MLRKVEYLVWQQPSLRTWSGSRLSNLQLNLLHISTERQHTAVARIAPRCTHVSTPRPLVNTDYAHTAKPGLSVRFAVKMDEVEDGIEVDDLPNFRPDSQSQFDVDAPSHFSSQEDKLPDVRPPSTQPEHSLLLGLHARVLLGERRVGYQLMI
eukprot:6191447-Pleurochrysis_carterae.AAC.3